MNILADYLLDLDTMEEWTAPENSTKVVQTKSSSLPRNHRSHPSCKRDSKCLQDTVADDCHCRTVPDQTWLATEQVEPTKRPKLEQARQITVDFDVHPLGRDEVSVTLEGERTLVVSGKHQSTDQSGHYVLHHYVRKVPLPSNAVCSQIRCQLDQFGHLAVHVPLLLPQEVESGVQNIPVEFVAPTPTSTVTTTIDTVPELTIPTPPPESDKVLETKHDLNNNVVNDTVEVSVEDIGPE